ncbi:MAG: TRAP transporter small permease [Syntrophomonadaceae bacterium]|nr:TRAP transporter small permease [Syntrophomonadaceae bacterium]MDD4550003.1 TRAP transporter small permease [Syntrophomonadaceae bacterium]
MKVLSYIDRFVYRIEEILLSYSIILMALVLIGNVLSRTLLHQSLTFAEEMGQFLLIIVTFVGTSYAVRKGKHIRMSALYGMLSENVRRWMMFIISIFNSGVMFILGYYAYQYTTKLMSLGTVSPALRIPMYVIVLFVPVTLLIAGIEYLRTAIKNIKEKQAYISSELIDDLSD